MEKILVIAAREFRAAVLNKAFLISLVMMPVLILISSNASRVAQGLKSKKIRNIAIIDRTPGKGTDAVATLNLFRQKEIDKAASDRSEAEKDGKKEESQSSGGQLELLSFEAIQAPSDPAEALKQRYDLGKKVVEGELAAFFDIGPAALEAKPTNPDDAAISYYTDRALDRDILLGVGVKLITIVQMQKTAGQNPLLLMRKDRRYSPEEITNLLEASSRSAGKGLIQKTLPTLSDTGSVVDGKEVQSGLRPLIPLFATLILFMVVLIGASPQLQGVIEEKMNRIGEVLLGSATPFQVLSGKLLGMTATGLTLSLVYLGGGLLAARHWNLAGDLQWQVPVWFVAFQILALLLYGSLFIAVGSACSDMKQAQTLLMPVSLAFSLPLMFLMPVMEDPTSTLSRVMSFIPLATPTLMLCRVAAAPNLPIWEPILGMVLVLITTIAAIWVAGRIFRIGYLSTGKAPSFLELTRWIFSGS